MTLKTSLFNKGIYKSTLRRYAWGSILYFILLFLSTGIMIMLNENPDSIYAYGSYGGRNFILRDYMIIPMLLSVVVPTIAGLLIFRFIHSRKASVFVHSLPVKRSTNYISSVLAALTLMAIPVVLNTVILMIMSVAAYSGCFGVGDCLTWMLLNIFSLFVMFSCVCFISSITGNSFAAVGLTIIFHIIGFILAAAFTMFAEIFLFGFAGEGELVEKVFNTAFITRIPTIMTSWEHVREEVLASYIKDIGVFFILALVLYVIGGIFYSKRRMETAEDVAGFKCLNHIFKYLVTFMGALATFSIFSSSVYEAPVVLWIAVFIVSGVAYFGSEMLLRKTLRVWKSYKGYIAFVIICTLAVCFCAFTSFFGYETYVPSADKIESAAVYNYYYNGEKPLLTDSDIIAKAQTLHEKMSKKRTVLRDRIYETRIHIEYKLDNGKTVHRVYNITEDELHTVMDSLYKNENFKKASEQIFTPMESVYSINVSGDKYVNIDEDKEKLRELVECVRKDISSLNYNRIKSNGWDLRLEINYVPAEVITTNDEITVMTVPGGNENIRIEYLSQKINPNFENTMNWLYENGYWEELSIKDIGEIYIAHENDELPLFNKEGEVVLRKDKFIKLTTEEDKKILIDYIQTAKTEYIPKNDRLVVYRVTNEKMGDYNIITIMTKKELSRLLPDYDLTGLGA